MTANIYDLVIVGAGPAAVAALAGLPDGLRIAVATGASRASSRRLRGLPAKIRAMAYERSEPGGITDAIGFADGERGGLFVSAAVGGLGNYWGQQVVRYAENDPWPRSLFVDHAAYIAGCERVERLFALSGGASAQRATAIGGGYEMLTPRLLIGGANAAPSHLRAMRDTFERLARSHKASVVGAAAIRWQSLDDHVRVELDDGSQLYGRRLLLAAGAVGTLQLTMASCPRLAAVSLRDHTPTMTITARLGARLGLARSDLLSHFNSLTIERCQDDEVVLFASLYSMSQAPLGLALAAAGLPPIGRGLSPPRWVDLLTPVQIWTPESHASYRIDRGAKLARITKRHEPARDQGLRGFIRWLNTKARVLRESATPAGEGFHYHGGQVSEDGEKFVPIDAFLRRGFDDRVICVDGSILARIGCRPHTLTAMAAAYQTVRTLYRERSPDLRVQQDSID